MALPYQQGAAAEEKKHAILWSFTSYRRTWSHKMNTDGSEGMAALVQLEGTREKPLGEAVYDSIRSAVQRGAFAPGERLRESTLADILGVSRTPIRDALRRLVSEGLLTQMPSRGVVVTDLDWQQVLELYALREILEGAAAAFAAHRADVSDVDLLNEIVECEVAVIERNDVNELADLNKQFHRALCEAAHNRYLTNSVRGIADALNLLPGTTLSQADRQRTAHEEHAQIISAIDQRDAELAESTARHHIREARRIRMRMLFPNRRQER